MYHPSRGGTRGGAAEFSWDDVRKDKDRENYLGHSILAPTGRWQNHKDVNWYNKDLPAAGPAAAELTDAQIARRQELQTIKEREQAEMERRLGRKPGSLGAASSSSVGDALLRGSTHVSSRARASGANTTNLDQGSRRRWGGTEEEAHGRRSDEASILTRDERRAARKLAKMEVRERRREERHAGRERKRDERSPAPSRERRHSPERERESVSRRTRRSRSRSRSPHLRSKERSDRFRDSDRRNDR